MKPVVFATERYEYLGHQLWSMPEFERGELERRTFPDGERYLSIGGDQRGRDAIVVGGTCDDAATLELYDLACGLVGLGVNTLSLAVPYFGYSTQERAVRAGDVVTAKARAVLLSSIPRARFTNEIVLLDLHTAGTAHYFEGHLHSVHLSGKGLALDVVRKIAAASETVVACTDAGRAKWVQELANEAGLLASFVYKARKAGGKTVVTGVNADVKDKHVVIYDDMVRSGDSLLQAARAYKDAGARAISAVTTHAVLPGDSLDKIVASKLLDSLHCTDSHPQARLLASKHKTFLHVSAVGPLIASYFSHRQI